MKARFLRFSSVEGLRAQIRENLSIYRSGTFAYLAVDSAHWFEHGVEVDDKKLSGLLTPKGQDLFEPHNSVTLYRAMQNISPYEARDERLWAYLTYTALLDHTRQRWPIPEDEESAISHVQKHFFARDKRQVERDNAASRLWWMAHLCDRVSSIGLEAALQAFLYRSDVRANIIERPTSAQSLNLFGAILSRLTASFAGKQLLFDRDTFRWFMREVNSVGGFRLLDCLSVKQIDLILDGILVEKLELLAL